MKDYYKILQVHPEASQEVVNNAYRALVRQYHPDLYHSRRKDFCNQKMQEINEAYEILSAPHRRSEYDQTYQKTYQSQPLPPRFSNSSALPKSPHLASLRQIALWAIGSFVIFKWLLKPLLFSPWIKILLLGAVTYGLIRLYLRKTSP